MVAGSSIGSDRTFSMRCTYAPICTHTHPYVHTRACSWVPPHSSQHPHIAHPPPHQPYATSFTFIWLYSTPLDHSDLYLSEKGCFHTYTTAHTPRLLIFTWLTPQIVAYDAWGGGGVIGWSGGPILADISLLRWGAHMHTYAPQNTHMGAYVHTRA